MVEILTNAGCFIGIILLGWALRRVGFFKESDFHVLSKIVIKITLTAAIVTNLAEVVSGMVKLNLVCIKIMYLLSKPMKLFYFQSFWNI